MSETRRANDYMRWMEEQSACIGYLHCLATGSTDYTIERLRSGAHSVDDGWTVTVDDGNQKQITGHFWPGSNIHDIAVHLGHTDGLM